VTGVQTLSDNRSFENYNQRVIDEFRANSGVVTGRGSSLLLLTTTGAKTGRQYTTPLAHTRDGEHYVILASKGGAPTNPAWYHNLVAYPEVTVEVGPETFKAHARVTADAERERLFNQMAEKMPGFAEYQRNTTRQIPVIVLMRIQE
jgi:deazaflavin-dependent oxidoreductase (nitroreductase family)